MKYEDYAKHDAISLSELVRRKEVSPGELLDAALARLDVVDGKINAVVHRMDDRARRAAESPLPEGPFRGVPLLVKDLDGALEDAPLTMGSRSLASYIAPRDSELFARYRRAGVVFAGKTNTPELGLLAITEPELHGPTRNPWSLDHTPGGSSGGSAAAVAAGVVPVAHGGDGGGSIRIPASCCGLFGLKPTRGRMPLGPEVTEGWHGFVVPHVISRSVRDSAAFLDATHGPDAGAPYVAQPPERPFLEEVSRDPGKLRVAFTTRSILGEKTDPECQRACEDAAKLLSSMGHDVVEATLPVRPEELRLAYLTVVAAGTAEAVNATEALNGRRPSPEDFEPPTWFLWQVGNALSAVELEHARTHVGRASRSMGAFFERFDVLITPTLAYPPSRVGELGLKAYERAGLAALRRAAPRAVLRRVLEDLASKSLEKTPNTMLFNMTGQPAMSVPLHWSAQGLPIGVQFVARLGEEATLLRLAGRLEEARPWAHRRPAILERRSVAQQTGQLQGRRPRPTQVGRRALNAADGPSAKRMSAAPGESFQRLATLATGKRPPRASRREPLKWLATVATGKRPTRAVEMARYRCDRETAGRNPLKRVPLSSCRTGRRRVRAERVVVAPSRAERVVIAPNRVERAVVAKNRVEPASAGFVAWTREQR